MSATATWFTHRPRRLGLDLAEKPQTLRLQPWSSADMVTHYRCAGKPRRGRRQVSREQVERTQVLHGQAFLRQASQVRPLPGARDLLSPAGRPD